MIDLAAEKLISLNEAARLIPPARKGRRCHPSTLHRWALRGVNGIQLEHYQTPRRIFTTREAVQRFLEALTPNPAGGGEQTKTPRSPAARAQAHRKAEQRLERVGI
jgi:hypothetical protein